MTIISLISRLLGSSSVPAIEHDDMQKAVESGECHIVDVREVAEYKAGHIPGAVNHPLSSFEPDKLPLGKPLILVCQAGGRSAKALASTHASGRKDAVHYAPGTGGWKQRGGKIAF